MAGGPAAQAPCTQALAHPSLRGSGQLYFGIKLPAGKIFSVFARNNKEKEKTDTLHAATVPALSLLRNQGIYFQGGCTPWAFKCDTLSEVAVAHVSIDPFHAGFLVDSEIVTFNSAFIARYHSQHYSDFFMSVGVLYRCSLHACTCMTTLLFAFLSFLPC